MASYDNLRANSGGNSKSSTANGYAEWHDFYFTNSKEICAGFFKNTDLNAPEKLWSNIDKLMHSEPAVFWSVVLHHPNLAKALQKCIDDADKSHASSKDRVSSSNQAALVIIITKIVLGFDPSFSKDAQGRMPTPRSIANRLLQLLPGHVIMPLALLLLRHSPSHASTVICGLFIQCPMLLGNFHATTSRLCDTLEDIASVCQTDAKRGRFQRKGAEILAQVERLYRTLKQLWGLLHSCPFIAEYCSTDRMMTALKATVDTACPMLQHFLMTCELLAPRRPQLTKAISSIVNASIDSASILTLFSRFICGNNAMSKKSGEDLWDGRQSISPTIVDAVNDSIHDHCMQHTTGILRLLVAKSPTIDGLFAKLCTPSDIGHSRKLGPILLSTITSKAKTFSASVFGVEYMSNLVRHGVSLDMLQQQKFLLSDEARQLGATEDKSTTHIALQDSETPSQQVPPIQVPPHTTTTTTSTTGGGADEVDHPRQTKKARDDEGDPLISVVKEVLPDAPDFAIKAALEFYNRNADTVINEAFQSNLPPHIQDMFDGKAGPPEDDPGFKVQDDEPNANKQTIGGGGISGGGSDGGSALLPPGINLGTDMHAFLTSDFHDDALSSYVAQANEGSGADKTATLDIPPTPNTGMQTGPAFGASTFSSDGMISTTEDMFGLDEDMKNQIRQLSEMMYEDELDDAQEDPTAQFQRLNQNGNLSESDGEDGEGLYGGDDEPSCSPGGRGGRGGGGRGGRSPPPNDGYEPTPGYMINKNKGVVPPPQAQGSKKPSTKSTTSTTGGRGSGGGKKYQDKPKNAEAKKKLRQQKKQSQRDRSGM